MVYRYMVGGVVSAGVSYWYMCAGVRGRMACRCGYQLVESSSLPLDQESGHFDTGTGWISADRGW